MEASSTMHTEHSSSFPGPKVASPLSPESPLVSLRYAIIFSLRAGGSSRSCFLVAPGGRKPTRRCTVIGPRTFPRHLRPCGGGFRTGQVPMLHQAVGVGPTREEDTSISTLCSAERHAHLWSPSESSDGLEAGGITIFPRASASLCGNGSDNRQRGRYNRLASACSADRRSGEDERIFQVERGCARLGGGAAWGCECNFCTSPLQHFDQHLRADKTGVLALLRSPKQAEQITVTERKRLFGLPLADLCAAHTFRVEVLPVPGPPVITPNRVVHPCTPDAASLERETRSLHASAIMLLSIREPPPHDEQEGQGKADLRGYSRTVNTASRWSADSCTSGKSARTLSISASYAALVAAAAAVSVGVVPAVAADRARQSENDRAT